MIAYFIGQSLSDVKALVEAPAAVGIEVSQLTLKLVQTAYYLFPNLSLFDLKIQAAHALPLSIPYLIWTLLYGIVYTALAIAGASFFFRRKELP